MNNNIEDSLITIQNLVDLTLEKRPPANKKEVLLQKQIEEIIAKGRIVEIPSEWP
jgi:hypothetical protein